MKTFSIKTFGCKVNQYESQAVREKFLREGYREILNGGVPFVCIVNTCCVTERAEKKYTQFINRIKIKYPGSVLIVTGCGVDYKPESFNQIDILVPNRKKSSIVNILNGKTQPRIQLERSLGGDTKASLEISNFTGRSRAFVKIQDGCDQFCSYCVLPYIRGRSRSRALENILDEVERLVSNGYREVVLTGIHLGDYNKIAELIELLQGFPLLLRIRLSSIEPQDITDTVLDVVSRNSKVCRHFHIPLQSGSDKILNLMNRRYNYLEYKRLIDRIRKSISGVTFTTDMMVGFPGEKNEDFLATRNAVEEIGFVKVHIFPYSPRAGTKAALFPFRISTVEIKRRCTVLKKVSDGIAFKQKMGLTGSIQEVLIENNGRKYCGYTSGYIPVKMNIVLAANELVNIRIKGIDDQYLIGEICAKSEICA